MRKKRRRTYPMVSVAPPASTSGLSLDLGVCLRTWWWLFVYPQAFDTTNPGAGRTRRNGLQQLQRAGVGSQSEYSEFWCLFILLITLLIATEWLYGSWTTYRHPRDYPSFVLLRVVVSLAVLVLPVVLVRPTRVSAAQPVCFFFSLTLHSLMLVGMGEYFDKSARSAIPYLVAGGYFGLLGGLTYNTLVAVSPSERITLWGQLFWGFVSASLLILVTILAQQPAIQPNLSTVFLLETTPSLLWSSEANFRGDIAAPLLAGFSALLMFQMTAMRLLDWIVGNVRIEEDLIDREDWSVPHVTWLTIGRLRTQMAIRLRNDWENTLDDLALIWRQTNQRAAVLSAVKEVLSEKKGDDLLESAMQLAKRTRSDTWTLEMFINLSLAARLRKWRRKAISLFKRSPFGGSSSEKAMAAETEELKKEQAIILNRRDIEIDQPSDDPPTAAIEGCYCLTECYPEIAADAFTKFKAGPLGLEMYTIAQTLTNLVFERPRINETLAALPTKPAVTQTRFWIVYDQFRLLLRRLWQLEQCEVRPQRELIIRSMNSQLASQETYLETRRHGNSELRLMSALLVALHNKTRRKYEQIAISSPRVEMMTTIANPYVAENSNQAPPLAPIRSAAMASLKTLLAGGSQRIIVSGMTKIGKSALLQQFIKATDEDSQCVLWDATKVSKANNQPTLVDYCHDLCTAIAQQTKQTPPPRETLMLGTPLEYIKMMIQAVCDRLTRRKLKKTKLILMIESLLPTSTPTFTHHHEIDQVIQYVADLTRSFDNLQIVVTTPLAESDSKGRIEHLSSLQWEFLKLGHLTSADTIQLFCEPSPDFLLSYESEAFERAFWLTGGYPYLVQLLGEQVVRAFNERVNKANKSRTQLPTPIIYVDDIDSAVSVNMFSDKYNSFFDRLMTESVGSAMPVLQIVSCFEGGATTEQIEYTTRDMGLTISASEVQSCLVRLKELSILETPKGPWKDRSVVSCGLLREWAKKRPRPT
jgi:hypothetical protein